MLLCGATVYIQAHYVIDAIVGFFSAFLLYVVVTWILHVRRHLAASPLFKGIPNFRDTRIAMLRAETKDDRDMHPRIIFYFSYQRPVRFSGVHLCTGTTVYG